jgi:coproporphyrinogen III oxidase-like Fe-S oxidoreductase
MEGYIAQVVDTLTAAGYRWYETANFCRTDDVLGRDLRSRHNLAYWLGRDYLGLGIGAVSTHGDSRWRNAPRLPGYLAALGHGEEPPRELEHLPAETRRLERVMLGLRLDEPLLLAGLEQALDPAGLARVEKLGLAERLGDSLVLTPRGRLVGDGVTAELVA